MAMNTPPDPAVLATLDLEQARRFLVRQRIRLEEDTSELSPVELNYYIAQLPAERARQEREAQKARDRADAWSDAEHSRQRAYEHAEHMRKARVWGREQGHFVGTRGAIPAAVRQAYQRETGYEL
ncbi:hypothetical protein ACIRBX_12065 [Kitasatospora sp. NPDC096147]|uniref:Lsr2 family DNA-binding protein n=1 Tax=Kitasatospora sp. NPDC096147 TaxID=3364093 RepID=UPI003810831B